MNNWRDANQRRRARLVRIHGHDRRGPRSARARRRRGRIGHAVRHARELLDIIEDEIAAHQIDIPGTTGGVLAQLRGRLHSLEKDVMPTRH